MNNEITPPPELVEQWYLNGLENDELGLVEYLATQAAHWGSDQELLACGKYLEQRAAWEEEDVTEMYNYRRPKPPSLKKQALAVLDDASDRLDAVHENILRRALEALDD